MRRSCVLTVTGLMWASAALAQPIADGLVGGPVVRYDGHALVAVELRSIADVRTMEAIGADQWSHHVIPGEGTDYLVSPGQRADLDAAGIAYRVVVSDIQLSIDAESARLRGPGGRRGWFDDFKDIDAINARLDDLAAARPDVASVIEIGRSLEGRSVRGLRIANDGFGEPDCKPTILFNACQHAREWISPMVAMYAADRLVNSHGGDPDLTALVDRAEIIVVPVVNADGYAYTWTTERLWRKNRRNNGDGTFGVDLNRNWSYEWGRDNGSSGNPSSDTYRGVSPFSEPETRIMRDLALSRPRLAAQVDLHSYGQLLLAPWGYSPDPPPEHDTFQMLGGAMQSDIRGVHGRTYRHGPCYFTLYPISGGAGDYFWGDRLAHNFLIELRGSSFILPPDQIIPNAEEVFPALVRFASWARAHRRPAGDFDDNARLDLFDYLAFQSAFGADDIAADLNADGRLNLFDFLSFQTAFGSGC